MADTCPVGLEYAVKCLHLRPCSVVAPQGSPPVALSRAWHKPVVAADGGVQFLGEELLHWVFCQSEQSERRYGSHIPNFCLERSGRALFLSMKRCVYIGTAQNGSTVALLFVA
jgi:hypothetical protein